MARFTRWLCALALAVATTAWAQPDRPAASRRLVRVFNFDQPEVHAIPQYWDRAQSGDAAIGGAREGFPRYNSVEHDTSVWYSGSGSVRLNTNGGSVGMRLQSGVVPVFPETEYMVSARVRTRGLTTARAAVAARFLDRTGKPLPGAEARSELAQTGPDEWRLVHCTLPGWIAGAAYLQVDLELLQAREFAAQTLGPHQVWPNDFPGQAWFDEVSIVQLPRVVIGTNDPTNIIQRPERPVVRIGLRDLTGEELTGRLSVQNAAGRVVDELSFTLRGGTDEREWTPNVTGLGWYRATLELVAASGRVGSTHVDFIWLPQAAPGAGEPRTADRARFQIILDELPAASRADLPTILSRLGTGGVAFPVWDAEATPDSVTGLSRDLLPLVTALRNKWQQVSFILPRLPTELASGLGLEPDQTLSALEGDAKAWSAYLLPLLDRYGQMVQRWQVGRVGDPPPRGVDLGVAVERFSATLSKLVPGPEVSLPWPAELSPGGVRGGQILAHVPYASPPGAMAALAEAWKLSPVGGSAMLVLEPLPESQFSRHDSAIRMVKQMVEFWGAFVEPPGTAGGLRGSVALVQPWSWPAGASRQTMPRVEAAIFASTAARLVDRRVVGRLPVAPGLVCYILAPTAPGRPGALVAWSEGASPDRSELRSYLGDAPVEVVDLWGNSRSVAATAAQTSGSAALADPPLHRIPLTHEPVFIENVDVGLARFIAGFRLEPDSLPCTASEHEVTVVLSNPFSTRAEGRLTILEPGGLTGDLAARDRSWRLTPRSMAFSIAPGQEARLPLSMAFSPMEEAGVRPFVAEVRLAADRDYGVFRMRTQFEIRLDSIQLEVSHRFVPGTGDVVVEAHLVNKGTSSATIELSAFAAGYPRSRASVADLPPGESATRRFAFPGGGAKLRGQRVVVGAQDADTRARVNRSIVVE